MGDKYVLCKRCGYQTIDTDIRKCKYCDSELIEISRSIDRLAYQPLEKYDYQKWAEREVKQEEEEERVRQMLANDPVEQRARARKAKEEAKSLYVPKCPTCGSPDVQKISIGKKVTGGALFGLFSSNVRKSYECNNCKYKW